MLFDKLAVIDGCEVVTGRTVDVSVMFALNIPITGSEVIIKDIVHAEALTLNGVIWFHVPLLSKYGAIEDDCNPQL